MLTQPRPIRLKGRSFLALALTPELPFEDWLVRLDDLAARSAGFFLRKPVVLDVEGLDIDRSQLREFVDRLATRNVRIIGIEGARPSLLGADLPPAMTNGRPASDFEAPIAKEADPASKVEAPIAKQAEPASTVEAPIAEQTDRAGAGESVAPLESLPARAMPSIIVSQPVRSGQSLFFPEGDVTVVGSVASGAEVVAGGSIHIYGTLRGRAMAGTTGNASARIFCSRLEAELVAIDGFYKTAEDLGPDLHGRAVQLWLEGEAIMTGTLG